jgi:hypothetical protein
MDHHGIADAISQVIDRKIVYRPDTLDQYRTHLQQYGLSEFTIQHFSEVAVDYQNGVFKGADQVIGRVTGQAPQTVAEFVRAHRQIFQS